MSRLKVITGCLWTVALLLASWTLWQLPLATISQVMTALAWSQWVAWFALNLGIILFSTKRWQVLITLLNLRVRFVHLLLIRQAGTAVSFIIPGPHLGGEPLQIYCLYKQYALPLHKAVLALGLDRFYEIWINFSLLLLGVLIVVFSPATKIAGWQELAMILLVMLLALSLLFWILLSQPLWLTSRMQSLARRWQQHPRLQQVENHWQAMGSDLQQAVKTQKPALLLGLLLSLLVWLGILLELRLLLSFLNIAPDLTTFIFIIVAMRLAMLLPVPGGIGTIEASLLWSFQTLHLPTTAAVGLIALIRLRDVVVLAAGLWCLRRMRSLA